MRISLRALTGACAAFELISCASLAACRAETVARASQACKAQVIVAFSGADQSPPDPKFVKAIATASRVMLTYVRSVNPELHVFVVTAGADDRDCSHALTRLRSDARIRSIDIDQRRVHH